MSEYSVGVDLGQMQDYTAIAVVALDEGYLEASRAHDAAYDRLNRAHKNPYLDEIDLREMERNIEERLGSVPEPIYEVRHLERLPLGTSYIEVARRVRRLVDTPPLRNNTELAVDATGVGAAVVDQLRAEDLFFKSVLITGGDKEAHDGEGSYRVPKRDLVAAAQVLLQNRRLKIAPSLPEARTLTEELLDFRYNITPAGNDIYGTWREGAHDDLVLALCLALWAAKRRSLPVDESLVTNIGPYSIGREDLFTISERDLFTLDEPYFRW